MSYYNPNLISPAGDRSLAALIDSRTYEDYLAEGRIWGAEKLAAAVWKNGSDNVETLARVFADINAPHAVRADWAARMKVVRDLEFSK